MSRGAVRKSQVSSRAEGKLYKKIISINQRD
jgi:hypothetical protein